MVFTLVAAAFVAVVATVIATVGVPNVHTEAAKQAAAADDRQPSLFSVWGLGKRAGNSSAAGPSSVDNDAEMTGADVEPDQKKPKKKPKR